MLSIKQGGTKYHYLSPCMTQRGIELQSPGPVVNTQAITYQEHQLQQV